MTTYQSVKASITVLVILLLFCVAMKATNRYYDQIMIDRVGIQAFTELRICSDTSTRILCERSKP